jgi:hypothetical protein
MRFQPNRDYVSNDVVQTPLPLARQLVEHFRPEGKVLEPCRGEGNIFRYLPADAAWCEISEGIDFLDYKERCDWIITNPPWSKIREFLAHGMEIADHVVFLMTVNHAWTKARVRDVREAGFGFRELVMVDMPSSFPQSGFQLGAVYWSRNWTGPITFTDFTSKIVSPRARAAVPVKPSVPKRPARTVRRIAATALAR